MSSDKAPFSWEDPFQMQSQFSEEERMIQESARDYAQDKLLSRVRDAFRHETFDREIMNEFGAMGMLGATLPEKYGCSNVNCILRHYGPRSGNGGLRLPLSYECAIFSIDAPNLCLRHLSSARKIPA